MQGSHLKGGKRGAGFTSTRGKGGGEIEHTGKIACPAIRFCRIKLFKWPDQSHGEGGGGRHHFSRLDSNCVVCEGSSP